MPDIQFPVYIPSKGRPDNQTGDMLDGDGVPFKMVVEPRFDDIWMGFMWQREANRRGFCFNLDGPVVRHARQSNVWNNLVVEARHLERNETLWADIAVHPDPTYGNLRALLPADDGGSDR